MTGADLHEPKGAATATSGQVYVANGSGSGTWTTDYQLNKGQITGRFADISTAETIYFVFPFACTVNRISTVISGAITVADSVITCTHLGVGSMGTITVAFTGSAEGTVDQLSPVSNNTMTPSFPTLKMVNDGASTTAQTCHVIVEFTRTAT